MSAQAAFKSPDNDSTLSWWAMPALFLLLLPLSYPSSTPFFFFFFIPRPYCETPPTAFSERSALHRPGVMFRELVDKVLYVYFNWRKGTVNDLTMVVAVNCVLVSIGAAMKMSVLPFLGAGVPADSQVVEQGTSFLDQVGRRGQVEVWSTVHWPRATGGRSDQTCTRGCRDRPGPDSRMALGASVGLAMRFQSESAPNDPRDPRHPATLAVQVYEVLLLTIFTEPPEQAATWLDKVFTVGVAVMGVASFAIILALIEQAVLESWERNVAKGGPVFEQGHTVVLGWLQSQLDISVLFKLLQELCLAHRVEGGRAFVILCSRPKMEMEELFRRVLPLQ